MTAIPPSGSGAGQPSDVSNRWSDSRQLFWSLAVGVPTVMLIMRLWVEAGGNLQLTLLLAANVSPVSLITVLITTALWLYSAVIVAAISVCSILMRSSPEYAARHPAVQAIATGPMWFKLSAFVLAAATWHILFSSVLLMCVIATFWQGALTGRTESSSPATERLARVLQTLVTATIAGGCLFVLWPTLQVAYHNRLWWPLILLAAPPLALLLGAAGPVSARLVPAFWFSARAVMGVMLALSVVPVLTTPILPLVVVITKDEDGELVPKRGNVVSVDDTSTALLRERGGLEFLPNEQVQGRILCHDDRDVPRYRLWVHGIHVEDSALQALGRLNRPETVSDHWCFAALHPERTKLEQS